MRLAESATGDVVQNVANGNFYRYERPEEDRTRIRPLELFPNGLLIAKPTDTIVEAGLLVRFVARWREDLYVDTASGPCKARKTFEREQARRMDELRRLRAEALVILPGQRGSHANKVKAVVRRLEVLNRGLADAPDGPAASAVEEMARPTFTNGQVVQLPSGTAARFLGAVGTSIDPLVRVRSTTGSFVVDPSVLAPIEQRWIATV